MKGGDDSSEIMAYVDDEVLVVEVDDESHHWRDETDRSAYLECQGFAIVRFTNHEIATDVGTAIQTISMWLDEIRVTGSAPDWW